VSHHLRGEGNLGRSLLSRIKSGVARPGRVNPFEAPPSGARGRKRRIFYIEGGERIKYQGGKKLPSDVRVVETRLSTSLATTSLFSAIRPSAGKREKRPPRKELLPPGRKEHSRPWEVTGISFSFRRMDGRIHPRGRKLHSPKLLNFLLHALWRGPQKGTCLRNSTKPAIGNILTS